MSVIKYIWYIGSFIVFSTTRVFKINAVNQLPSLSPSRILTPKTLKTFIFRGKSGKKKKSNHLGKTVFLKLFFQFACCFHLLKNKCVFIRLKFFFTIYSKKKPWRPVKPLNKNSFFLITWFSITIIFRLWTCSCSATLLILVYSFYSLHNIVKIYSPIINGLCSPS